MRRSALAVIPAAAATAALASASLAVAGSTHITPYQGHYSGHDSHSHSVSMDMHNHKIVHFEVSHVSTNFPEVHFSGHQFHHTCNSHGWCIRGEWKSNHRVHGTWNNSHTGKQGTFTVNAVAS